MYNTPGRLVSIHPVRGNALAAFIFRGGTVPALDYRDTHRHKQMLPAAYRGAGWMVPELLERLRVTGDLYFDSVSQVRLPTWSRGRIGVVGDAASCVSLFGDGSSLAMAGAFALATALAEAPEPTTAFHRYEAVQRPLTNSKQRNLHRAAALLVPKTRFGLSSRNLVGRLWPT